MLYEIFLAEMIYFVLYSFLFISFIQTHCIIWMNTVFVFFSSAPSNGSILHVWAWQPSQEANGKKVRNQNVSRHLCVE